MVTAAAQKTGKVVQVIGPVIDIEFAEGLPDIYNAVRVVLKKQGTLYFGASLMAPPVIGTTATANAQAQNTDATGAKTMARRNRIRNRSAATPPRTEKINE